MEKISFGKELLEQIQSQVRKSMETFPGPYYAAFDADGTLWDSDLGEQFFQYEIDHCSLPPLQNVDPWEYYESTKAVDPVKAYLWLAQINEGQHIDQVRKWAHMAVEHFGAKVFQCQKQLIAWLKSQGVEVFIVTASIQWAVEPAAHLVGIDKDHVLGIRTKVNEQGIVTTEQDGPITWRDGKASALLTRTNNVAPILCCGNTYGDIALIEASRGVRLAVQTQVDKNSLFEEENKLFTHAEKSKWNLHHFFK